MNATALKTALLNEAHRLGFTLAGITTPQTPPHYPAYLHWLGAGNHAQMGYLENDRARECRADPKLLLPECESLLILGMPYGGLQESALPQETAPPQEPHGRIAAYAWGRDYHNIIPPLLRQLVTFLQEQIGAPIPHRLYTDTGPILERDFAQLAGLGWIGKNTCLINPRYGSAFLLAEILLGIALPPDEPFRTDHCGNCTRCIQACPTQCILPNRTLDARRCISYLTIENKGEIPSELKPLLGEWIFGCDICQQVCPWNIRFAHRAAAHPALQQNPMRARVPLASEIHISREEFSHKYKGSPVKRAKWKGYIRNISARMGLATQPIQTQAES